MSSAAATKKDDEVVTDYPGKGIPAVDAAIKDGTWKIKMDKNSNKPFFYNPTSKETTWDLAKKLGVVAGGTAASSTSSSSAARPKSPPAASTNERPKSPIGTRPAPASSQAESSIQQSQQRKQQLQSHHQQQQQQQQQNYDPVNLSDPIQRLLEHNKKLVSDIASHEAESIKAGMASFETRLDLLVHANNVLAVQLDRRNQEANALQQALTEAHDTIHKLRNDVKNHEDAKELANYARTSSLLFPGGSAGGGSGAATDGGAGLMKVSNDEAKRSIAIALETVGRTVVHLQEQNRSLSTTIASLTAQLIQNVQSSSAARSMDAVADQPHEWWKNAKGYSVAALTSRFLDSPGRNALCPKCLLRISDFRDQLLREVPMSDAEKQVQEQMMSQERQQQQHQQLQRSPPLASRIGLQPATTPISSYSSAANAAVYNQNSYNTSSAQPQQQQRVQPQYVPVTIYSNNVPQQQSQRGGGGGGAFSNVANNYYSNPRGSPTVNNSNSAANTIRPGALFGGR